jgi:hypothetical protein
MRNYTGNGFDGRQVNTYEILTEEDKIQNLKRQKI